jgi:hypothetical protein
VLLTRADDSLMNLCEELAASTEFREVLVALKVECLRNSILAMLCAWSVVTGCLSSAPVAWKALQLGRCLGCCLI